MKPKRTNFQRIRRIMVTQSLSAIKRIALVLLVAGMLTTCDSLSDFGDLNQDPTQANTVEPGMQFTTIQLGAAGSRYEMWRANLIYSSAVVQHLVQTWWAGNTYGQNMGWLNAFYNVAYSGEGVAWRAQIKNVQDLIGNLEQRKADGESVDNLLAAARIMRVFVFHRVTDLYGDIPYSEGGKGFLEQNFAPAFDTQQSIYANMFTELEEAVNQFDGSQPKFDSADLIYGGDIAQWQKFANSLRLRLALRLVKVDAGTAQQQAVNAVNAPGGVMTSNADIAMIQHQTGPSTGPAGVNTNGNSEVFSVDDPFVSQTMVEWMNSSNDPRLGIYAETDTTVFIGWPSGYGATTVQGHPSWTVANSSVDNYSRINDMLTDLDDPMFFQTYAEVEFMLAELAARNWTSDNAETHYNAGVRAAMEYLSLYDPDGGADIADADITDYLTNNPFNAGGTQDEQLEQINTQYWAATFLNGIEAYSNWRRSGYPDLEEAPVDDPDPAPGSDTNGEFIRRFLYPENEGILNAENYQEVISRQGPNSLTTRVWWDVE